MQKVYKENYGGAGGHHPRRANYGEGGNQYAKKPSANNRP